MSCVIRDDYPGVRVQYQGDRVQAIVGQELVKEPLLRQAPAVFLSEPEDQAVAEDHPEDRDRDHAPERGDAVIGEQPGREERDVLGNRQAQAAGQQDAEDQQIGGRSVEIQEKVDQDVHGPPICRKGATGSKD